MNLGAKIATVQFDGDDVRVLVVKTGGKYPIVLESYSARAQYTDPEQRQEAMTHATADVVQQVKGPVSAWLLVASSLYGIARSLRIPFKGHRKVSAVVPGELEPNLAVPIDDLVIDHVIVREYQGQTDVLAVALRRTLLQEQAGYLASAGIGLEGITVDVSAVASLWRTGRRSAAPLEGILQIGQHGSLFIVVTPKALAWYRHLAVTAEQARTNPDAVVRDVQNSIRSFLAKWEGETQIASLTLTGAAATEDLLFAFSDALDIPVTCEDLLANIKGLPAPELPELRFIDDADNDDEAAPVAQPPTTPDYVSLVGAAVSASGGAYSLNFMEEGLGLPTQYKGLVTHGVFSGALAFVAVLGYGIYCYADYRHNERELNRIGEQIFSIYRECFPNSEFTVRPANDVGGVESLALLEADGASLESPLAGLPMEWFAKPRILDILLEISKWFPEDKMRLTNLSIRGDLITISLEVSLQNLSEFQRTMAQIKEQSTILRDAISKVQSTTDTAHIEVSAPY